MHAKLAFKHLYRPLHGALHPHRMSSCKDSFTCGRAVQIGDHELLSCRHPQSDGLGALVNKRGFGPVRRRHQVHGLYGECLPLHVCKAQVSSSPFFQYSIGYHRHRWSGCSYPRGVSLPSSISCLCASYSRAGLC